MNKIKAFSILFLVLFIISCGQTSNDNSRAIDIEMKGMGALLTTRFTSMEDFKKVVQIEYSTKKNPWVKLTHKSNGYIVTSKLESGVSESDIIEVRDGNVFDKIGLTASSPFFVIHRMDLMKLYILSRRRHLYFGWADVAFYDLAENMMKNISPDNLSKIPLDDLSEKGFINTFNHITAQSFMTSIFSEELADFVADTHERSNMPELISGKFTKEQLEDIKNGAVDNYVDIINNEWGQEVGKFLKKKYDLSAQTIWTPELLANYLNELQSYFGWVFKIGFTPFRVEDEVVVKFSKKINSVMQDVSGLR